MVAVQLRNLPYHEAISDLQERLVSEVQNFRSRALRQGFPEEQVKIASYFLCCLIDDTVLNTPWGSKSSWGQSSLSVRFHKEVWGGEKFFEILERLLQRPSQYVDLLELAYFCLSLGFEGKYRVRADGLRALEQLRHELYLVLTRIRGDVEGGLSLNWKGLHDLRSPLIRFVPLWVLAAVAGSLLMIIYLGFAYAINSASNRIYSQWVDMPAPTTPRHAPPMKAADPGLVDRFRKLLAGEIARNLVEVLDGPVLRITNAFPSGSDRIRKEFEPMLVKIALEIKNDTNPIEVIGHTDNIPIFTPRFQSNWDLSTARAKNVAEALDASGGLGKRITFKGRAEKDPVAANDTPEHRALNRRIDIHIR
jgi:type VI secretion system protein ImpK